eukprot:10526849-Ditylum_brightwellii.AAC.1
MHASTHLLKILKNHGWECCSNDEEKIIEPIHPNSIKKLESTTSPYSETECEQLKAEEGFSYQAAIKELIFSYVICYPDIGYAVAKLSKFSTMPAQ